MTIETENALPPPPPRRPRYYGVRCACGTYLAFEEVRGNPQQARYDRLDQPAWIVCEGCDAERQYFKHDVIVFSWPPESEQPPRSEPGLLF